MEFYATIKENAFWQSSGIDRQTPPLTQTENAGLKKKNTFKMHDVLARE